MNPSFSSFFSLSLSLPLSLCVVENTLLDSSLLYVVNLIQFHSLYSLFVCSVYFHSETFVSRIRDNTHDAHAVLERTVFLSIFFRLFYSYKRGWGFRRAVCFFRPRRARENRPLINIFFHLFYSYKRGRSLRRTVCISGHVALQITVLLFIFFHLLILTNEAEVFSSTTKTSRHYDLGKFLYRCATHTVCDLALAIISNVRGEHSLFFSFSPSSRTF